MTLLFRPWLQLLGNRVLRVLADKVLEVVEQLLKLGVRLDAVVAPFEVPQPLQNIVLLPSLPKVAIAARQIVRIGNVKNC
jgi:hypothetical protein